MSGRTETRTPEPPDRDEHEGSHPRLARPKRTTRPPNNYAREQEIDTEQRNTRSQRRKKNQGKPVAQSEAVPSDSKPKEAEEMYHRALAGYEKDLAHLISTNVPQMSHNRLP
ncbi:hypothetical protein PENFLA_c095G06093 [Penicillium flavigenum]|uniref:Uncharacterized protein n=1 Tax=Penicillium flavigenum TaxID=254877 RepID=A0A1V6S8I0_9EURO|nr:hypothetical protein PENFLA_c095G06093 [Penicillium flavigenum]